MNTLPKSRVAPVAPIIALSAPAFASLDGLQDFNVNFAKLTYAFDTDGIINADERGLAERYIRLS